MKWGGPIFPAPSFLRPPPGVLGLRYALAPPRPGRPVAWREVSRKARIDVLTVAVNRLQRRAGGRPGGRRELFPFRNPAPTLRNPRL